MPTALLPRPIRGIIPPMITPLLDAATLDREGLVRLIEHIVGGGVNGLFILGTTGEGPSLPYALRRDLVSETCALVRGRVPVLVGVTDTAYGELIAMAEHAAAAGASAVVVAPPPYFTATQGELLGYLQRVATAAPLPVLLYNIPSHTKVFIEANTVRRAAELPNVIGLKDSSGDLTHFHRVQLLLAERPDFTLLVGPEEMLAASVLLGGHGGVNGGANLMPELYVALFNAARAGDLPQVHLLHRRVMALSTQLYSVGRSNASVLLGLKCALALRGICHDAMAEPFSRLSAGDRAVIAERLEGLDLVGHTVPA